MRFHCTLGMEGGGSHKEYPMYDFDNVDHSGRPLTTLTICTGCSGLSGR